MTKLLLVVAMLALTACGQTQSDQDDEIFNLQQRTKQLEAEVKQLSATLSSTLEMVFELEASGAATQTTITEMQAIADAQQATLTQLATAETITEMHDFCGPKPGAYNEVGMQTTSGKILVYFENGGQRFLTVLVDGSYMTSDGTGCYFQVVNGQITNEHY